MFPLLTSPGPDLTRIAVSQQSSNRRVRPRLVWRNGTLLASPVVHGCQVTSRAVCGTCGFLRTIPGGVSAPSCCAFIKRVILKEVSGHRVLMKSGPGYRGRSAFGTTHVANLEFPHETSLILRCAAKVMKPFQTKQRIRPSCGDQEGRRGPDVVVPGTSVFSSSQTCVEELLRSHQGCQYRFALQDGTWDFLEML